METLHLAVTVLAGVAGALSLELILVERRIRRLEALPSIKDFLKQSKSKKKKK